MLEITCVVPIWLPQENFLGKNSSSVMSLQCFYDEEPLIFWLVQGLTLFYSCSWFPSLLVDLVLRSLILRTSWCLPFLRVTKFQPSASLSLWLWISSKPSSVYSNRAYNYQWTSVTGRCTSWMHSLSANKQTILPKGHQRVLILLQVSTKWAICCLGFPLPSNYCSFGGW